VSLGLRFVRFEVVQPINAKRRQVLRAVVDPRLYESMGSTKSLAPPVVLDCTQDGDLTHLRVRYRFDGNLSRAARAALDPSKMTWVIELDVDSSTFSAEFRVIPDHYPDRIRSSGTYRFEKKAKATVQVMEGELVVRAPLVAGVVEKAIVGGFREHMAEEAAAVERFTAEHPDESAD